MSMTINVLDSKQAVASYRVSRGNLVEISGRAGVNYQLIDARTGHAPENIIAERSSEDLHLKFDDGDAITDVIIHNYYDGNDPERSNSNSMLVGMAENGKLYPYVPESGIAQDAVSMLDPQQAAPQALGGEEMSDALWVFSPWWLLGLALLGGGIAAADSSGDETAIPTGTITTDLTTTQESAEVIISGSSTHLAGGTTATRQRWQYAHHNHNPERRRNV